MFFSLMKKFYSINPEKVQKDFHHRFSKEDILTKFPVLEVRNILSIYV